MDLSSHIMWDYINKKGELLNIGPFGGAWRFINGLALCRRPNGRYGFISHSGEFVISPKFIQAQPFLCEYTEVQTDEGFRAINKKGEFIFDRVFDFLECEGQSLWLVGLNNKYGYIDSKGDERISIEYDFARSFAHGMAAVCNGNTWGVVNESAEVILQPTFLDCKIVSDNLIATQSNKSRKWCLRDVSGRQCSDYYSSIGLCRDGLISFSTDGSLYGYMDRSGKVIIKAQFDYTGWFRDGISIAKVGKRWGAINKKGDFICRPQFYELGPFHEGLSVAREKGKSLFGFVNPLGEWVIPPSYQIALGFGEGMAAVVV